MEHVLDFEKPIIELEQKIKDLQQLANTSVEFKEEIKRLEKQAGRILEEVFSNLTIWQKVQLSRHLERPYTMDYIETIFTDFIELHGDRLFGDDPAMVTGIARLEGSPVVVIGQQKGRSTMDKVFRNFGMSKPEGYRKALRIAKLGEKFSLPIVTFIDTPGAYPGLEAEERGQAEAIARNIEEFSQLRVPIIVVIIGEGGSGGALAIGVGDRIYMLEYSTYSVISPEGCASILFRDATNAALSAEHLRITANEIAKFDGIIDGIISEPVGGAHRNPQLTALSIKEKLIESFRELGSIDTEALLAERHRKFRAMGVFLQTE